MILGSILEAKRAEIAALASVAPAPPAGPRGGTAIARLARGPGDPLRLVTEIKRRSPSAGPLSTALSVAARAEAYAAGGATMISVLADAPFFDGGWSHVAEARRAAGTALVLAKEFVLDERQLEEAAAMGADMALLIVRIVPPARLEALVARARGLGLEPLVEVVTEEELAIALDAGAVAIGVNARDLDTLTLDAARAARVLAAVPEECVAIHLSGVKDAATVGELARSDVDGALIGEALMRLDDPTPLLAAMAAAAR